MKNPKFKVGQTVVIGKSPVFTIKAIDTHGGGHCDCCQAADTYFMYNTNSNVWVNEDQLSRPTIN